MAPEPSQLAQLLFRARCPAWTRLVALLLLLGGAGCGSDPDERVVTNELLRVLAIDEEVTVHAYPASMKLLEDGTVRLHAAGARTLLCLENRGRRERTVQLELHNVSSSLALSCSPQRLRDRLRLVLDPLPEQETDDPGGASEPLPDPRCVPAGELVPGRREAPLRYVVQVAAGQSCAGGLDKEPTVTLAPRGALSPGQVHFAVAGDLLGDRDLLYRIGDALRRRNLEFLVLLGNVTSGTAPRSELRNMAAVLEELQIPVYATLGEEDLTGGGDRVFRELFGPTDSQFIQRRVRFILLDSADRMLAPSQHDWLADVLQPSPEAGVTLLFTHTPPFDPVGLRDQGFSSHREASRLMAALADGGVDALFCGGVLDYHEVDWAGVPGYVTGAVGSEAFDDIEAHFLEVRLDSRYPDRPIEVERVDLE